MNQFKKWYKTDWGNSLEEETAAERAWRAALEWIRSRHIKRLISVNEIDEELGD